MKDIARNFRPFGVITVSGVTLKCYGIWTKDREEVTGNEFHQVQGYLERASTPWPGLQTAPAGFAILHRGASMDYLVVGYWGNGNELFIHVFVRNEFGAHDWRKDERYSCCVWDLEVIDQERRLFISTVLAGDGETGLNQYLDEHITPVDERLFRLVQVRNP